MGTQRRSFIAGAVVGGSALVVARGAAAQAAAVLLETDPLALAWGYKADTDRVDKVKFAKHTSAQMCSGCRSYQGKPSDTMAVCMLVFPRQVAGKGWCQNWAKKEG